VLRRDAQRSASLTAARHSWFAPHAGSMLNSGGRGPGGRVSPCDRRWLRDSRTGRAPAARSAPGTRACGTL